MLRFEQRYSKRIATQLKIGEVTGASLYDEEFYINVLEKKEKKRKRLVLEKKEKKEKKERKTKAME